MNFNTNARNLLLKGPRTGRSTKILIYQKTNQLKKKKTKLSITTLQQKIKNTPKTYNYSKVRPKLMKIHQLVNIKSPEKPQLSQTQTKHLTHIPKSKIITSKVRNYTLSFLYSGFYNQQLDVLIISSSTHPYLIISLSIHSRTCTYVKSLITLICSIFFNPTVTQTKFIEIIQELHSFKETTPLKTPLFIFERSRDAALHNAIVLEQFNFNIDKVINSQVNSQVSFGSEFKKSSKLQELLTHHPHWLQLKNILDNGASFPLIQLSQENRSIDLSYHKDRENHKSAIDNQEILDKIITEDIERGFTLPLPLEIINL
jgi:hypothetical protein